MLDNLTEAEKVRAIRNRMNLTQASLARVIGVSTATISRWESGGQYPRSAARALIALLHQDPKTVLGILIKAWSRTEEQLRERQQKFNLASVILQALPR